MLKITLLNREDVGLPFKAKSSNRINTSQKIILLILLRVLTQFFYSPFKIRSAKYPNFVLPNALATKDVDRASYLKKQRKHISRNAPARHDKPIKSFALKKVLNVTFYHASALGKLNQNLPVLRPGSREFIKRIIYINRLIIVTFLCADRLPFSVNI